MSRKKTEVNPLRAKRLKELIEGEGIEQYKFAEKIGYTQQAISRIINMKNALTEETARIIIKNFPPYRLEWLLGYDDYKNNMEYLNGTMKESQTEADLLYSGVLAFLKLSGYDIAPAHENDGTIEGIVKNFTAGYVIKREDKSVTLDSLQFNKFANKISDYVEFELQHMIK